jgi:hypothetical protein
MNIEPDRRPDSWKSHFNNLLPLYGHRNWIVIADAAYPAQSNPGIETLATGCEHLKVLGTVLDEISASRHVRVKVYLDAELKLVEEEDAPGVLALRHEMIQLLPRKQTRELLHEQIIAKLDQAGSLFRVLILKSTLAIPYTSVFLELDCGYWSEQAEKRLRSLK